MITGMRTRKTCLQPYSYTLYVCKYLQLKSIRPSCNDITARNILVREERCKKKKKKKKKKNTLFRHVSLRS